MPSAPTRRDLLRAVTVAGAAGVLGSTSTSTSISTASSAAVARPFLPYSSGSFFRSSVRGAPVDRGATREFRAFMRTHREQRDTRFPLVNGLDTNRWGTAYAMGRSQHPVWTLVGDVPREVAVLAERGFHAPRWLGGQFSGTNDSPFVVIDRVNGWTVYAANARVVAPRTVHVSDAGLFRHDSNGLDGRSRRSSSTRNYRSRGVIPDAMVIRRDLVRHGINNGTGLGHVLHLFLVETRSAAGHCHPMIGSESGQYGWGAEGTRIALSPRVDVARRGLNAAGRVIARALQQHGAYIGDNSGAASALKAEQASRDRDPWSGTAIGRNVLRGLTWDDFVVLPRGWQ